MGDGRRFAGRTNQPGGLLTERGPPRTVLAMTSPLADVIEAALDVALTPDPEGGINTVGTEMLVRRAIADH